MRIAALLFLPLLLLALPREERVPGGIALLPLQEGERLLHLDRELGVVVAEKGRFAVLGIPLDYPEEEIILRRTQEGVEENLTLKISSKEYATQHITLQSSQRVVLSQEDLERHTREKELVALALEAHRKEPMQADLLLPVPGRVSGEFGLRRVFNGHKRAPHKGLDIAAPRGTPVLSAAPGVVVATLDLFFNGKSVFIEHGGGLITLYSHLDSFSVAGGQVVGRGEKIGAVGSTGRSTGPHLHFGVLVANTWVNPQLFLGESTTLQEEANGE